MIARLPRIATATAAARLPPLGLDGLDPALSRLVPVRESATGLERGWHVLDNLLELESRGIRPLGTVLCVHGNPTWSYLWRRLLTAATDAAGSGRAAWRVIAVDQLEMGFSERTGSVRTLADRVRDLADLTASLDLQGPIVTFGHDWGGVVSLGWAVDHRQQLAGVMLLNTAVHHPVDEPIPAPLRVALGVLGPATVTTPAFLETTLALAYPSLPPSVRAAYRAPYRAAARRGGIGGFVADIPADASHPSRRELDRIAAGVRDVAVPSLMLWGPRDPIFGDRYLDDLAERMPHADIHRFEGAGHLVAEDRAYADAVLTWLGDRVALQHEPHPVIEPVETCARGEVTASSSSGAMNPPTGAANSTSGDPRPLWSHLDDLRDSNDTVLIQLRAAGRITVSWRLLSRRVRQIAAGLHRLGVRHGDRVSLLVPPGADLTAVLYACLRVGAVVVVADAGLGLSGLTRAVRGARPDWVIGAAPGITAARTLHWPGRRISTARYPAPVMRALGVEYSLRDLIELGRGESLPAPPQPDDTAAVLFTSGSTGPAKGVVYTHRQLAALCAALAGQYGVGVGTGLVAGFAPFALLGPALGARSVTPDMDVTAPRTLTARAIAAAVEAADGTVVFLSPAAIANVIATADELSASDRQSMAGVRTFLSAGAPVAPSMLEAASALMPNATAHTPYGMTEGLLMTDISLDEVVAASSGGTGPGGVVVGWPVAGVRLRISALDGSGDAGGAPSVATNVTGEILVSAAHVEDHYDRLWVTDRAARRGAAPGERWHRTGDVGHLDDRGRLWVEGRMSHVIVAATGPVTPVGPEQRIQSTAEVSRAAIVGVGPRGTQQIVAVVEPCDRVTRPGLASPELAASVRAAAGVPLAAVLAVRQLPTDIRHNSKIDRVRVGEWASRILAGGRMTRP